jgi:hypothetical protein
MERPDNNGERSNNGNRRRYKSSIVLPSILIIVGVLILLYNLGLVDLKIWVIIARFWPLILIALGIELIMGRGSISRSILLLVVLWIVFGMVMRHPTPRGAITSSRIERPLTGITSAEIEISMGIGELILASLSDSPYLITGTVETAVGEWPREDFKISNGKARFVLNSDTSSFFHRFDFFGIGAQPARKWELALAESIPISLDIRTGVGGAYINLERVSATDVRISTGVVKTTLTLPAKGYSKVELSGGIGETIIRIPRGVAARIRTTTGIGSIQVRGNYSSINDEYVSPDFDSAENRVELNVKGGIGSIRIEG